MKRVGREPADLGLVALAAGALAGGVLWAAGAVSARLAGHRVPPGRPLAGLAALAHPGDPALAWGAPVGPPALYWASTLACAALVAVLAYAGAALVRRRLGRTEGPLRAPGLASRAEVAAASGRRALLARAAVLRPSLVRPAAQQLGFCLGRSRGVECWASVEDSMVVLGPPRSGKGMNLVVPAVLDAPGAVVTTSTRPDNLTVTLQARKRLGPVAVFDPQGLARGVPAGLRWSPVRGCEVPRTAMLRAGALCADAGESVTESSYWRQQTQIAVRCLLHAAAVGARPTSALYTWSLSAPMAAEAVEVLSTHPGASPGWGKALDSICGADPRTRDSIWSMVTNAFSALADPDVLEALSPEDDEAFDPERFLRDRGCLYLLGTAAGASATANLVAAFIEDVVEAARRLAARSVGARLDPPLALVLDEAANYPLPSLPALMSEGGGTGITTMAVLQSLSQARDRWGRERAGAIWDAAIVKVVLGGSANADDLADISRLVGERDAEERSVSSGSGGRTVSVSTRPRPVLEPSMLRRIGFGHGLLLLRSAPPAMLQLRPWTARRDAPELRASRAELEEALRRAATAAATTVSPTAEGAGVPARKSA